MFLSRARFRHPQLSQVRVTFLLLTEGCHRKTKDCLAVKGLADLSLRAQTVDTLIKSLLRGQCQMNDNLRSVVSVCLGPSPCFLILSC